MNWTPIFGISNTFVILYSYCYNKYYLYKSIYSSYWRSLISIACNLHRTRELRDLFVDLCEKLIEPWRQNVWARDHVNKFLGAITQSVLDLEISR